LVSKRKYVMLLKLTCWKPKGNQCL
jgi:hypothetical protein